MPETTNQILTELAKISANMETLKDTQELLRSEISEVNQNLQKKIEVISNTLNGNGSDHGLIPRQLLMAKRLDDLEGEAKEERKNRQYWMRFCITGVIVNGGALLVWAAKTFIFKTP